MPQAIMPGRAAISWTNCNKNAIRYEIFNHKGKNMRIALIADLHLSDVESTPQEETLNWALEELQRLQPDACAWLGDITACGDPDAASRFCEKLQALPFPSLTVPGNSDIRTPDTAPLLRRFLCNYPRGLRVGEVCLLGIDTADDHISEGERERLSRVTEGADILLCSHQPAKYLDENSRTFLETWIAAREKKGQHILLWASGHRHVYEQGELEGVPTVSLRALDPDKCIRGTAQILVFDTVKGLSCLEEVCYTRGMPEAWSDAERAELADALGITCYNRSKAERDMPFAIANGVRHLEWRSIGEGELALLERWRKSGGKTFSLHLPSLGFDTDVLHKEKFRASAQDAVRAEADMVTVHPPHLSTALMQSGSDAFEALADAMAEALLPVARAGIDILVENNHTSPGTKRDILKLPYGCTPMDILGWRNALRERLGANTCHLRLDVGHARNNMPLSQEYPIGKWYAQIGPLANAYHLHQTVFSKEDKKMHNHHPITGWHNGFVSFDGFLWAWHVGVLHHGPVILEIREGEGAPATWMRLQKLLCGE